MNRAPLSPAVRAIVRDLAVDARCAYRDAHLFPNSAPDLIRYADRCRQEARQILAGAPVTLDRYGWPVLYDAP